MAVESVAEIFETHIPNRLKNKPELVAQIGSSFKFVVTGDGGGTWLVDLTQEGGKVTAEDGDGKCTLTITANDLIDVVNGKLNGQMAFMSGKLKVAGDIGLAMKLGALFG